MTEWNDQNKKPMPKHQICEGLWAILAEDDGGQRRQAGFARADVIYYVCDRGHDHFKILCPTEPSGYMSSDPPHFWRPQQDVPSAITL